MSPSTYVFSRQGLSPWHNETRALLGGELRYSVYNLVSLFCYVDFSPRLGGILFAKNILMVKLISLAIILTFSTFSNAKVWQNENIWSPEWELKYSKWVEDNWTDDIFVKTDSILHDIKSDCADASYAMRALFSYINKLPFKIRRPKAFNQFITNETNQYDNIKDSTERFRKFFDGIRDQVGSGNLSDDTYPIAINRDYFRGGIVYVSPNDHTYQIKKLNANGIPTTLSSTTPAEVRFLTSMENFPFYIPSDFANHRDGFRAFKQPQHYDLPETQLPGYSLEQFEISKNYKNDKASYDEALIKMLKISEESLHQKAERIFQYLCNAVNQRSYFIRKTLSFRGLFSEQCLPSTAFEEYSTPSRDGRIKLMYQYLYKNIYLSPEYSPALTGYALFLDGIFKGDQEGLRQMNDWCKIESFGELEKGQEITLKTVWDAIQADKLISDPNANFLQRWGLQDYKPVCRQYGHNN